MRRFFEHSIDTEQVQRLAGNYPVVFVDEAVKVLRLITARLESDLVRNTPRGVGGASGLAGSMFGEVSTSGMAVTGMVGTPLPYGQVIEYGRRPGSFPPVAPIALWAERKLGVPADESFDVALAIARKIYHKGTEGAHMFGDTWEKNEAWAKAMLDTIPARVVRRLSDGGA